MGKESTPSRELSAILFSDITNFPDSSGENKSVSSYYVFILLCFCVLCVNLKIGYTLQIYDKSLRYGKRILPCGEKVVYLQIEN